MDATKTTSITLLRHAEATHNIRDPRFKGQIDPGLSPNGISQTDWCRKYRGLRDMPDLILVSPMTRTIETAIRVFDIAKGSRTLVQVCPDLRETGVSRCNVGLTRIQILGKYSHLGFDVTRCHDKWDYPYTRDEDLKHHDSQERAERVRSRLRALQSEYPNIAVVSHRGFLSYLAQGPKFETLETREYVFHPKDEKVPWEDRYGFSACCGKITDFGPTVLKELEGKSSLALNWR